MSINNQPNIIQMILTVTQKKVLEGISGRLVYGDIKAIAEKSKLHRYTVSRRLSVNSDSYNEDVVQAAINIISAREQVTKKSLAQLIAN